MSTPALYGFFFAVLLSGFCSGVSAGESGEAFSPVAYQVERYRHIWEKSPFVTATAVVRESGGLAERFVLTGAASLQNQPMIFVLDRQSLTRLMVTKEPNQQGLALVSVEGAVDPKQSQAVIRLGSEQAVIRYDSGALNRVNQTAGNTTPQQPASPGVAKTVQEKPSMPPMAARSLRRLRVKLAN